MKPVKITYTDFNDVEQTETFYFHLSELELTEWEVDVDGGMGAFIQKIVESKNGRELIKMFKDIILRSYGVRSEDGKRFIKNDQVREEFYQSAAFNELFLELSKNATAAAEFVKGIIPKSMAEEAEKAEKAILAEPNKT